MDSTEVYYLDPCTWGLIDEELRLNHKITAIKIYKDFTNFGLREAKEVIDLREKELGLNIPTAIELLKAIKERADAQRRSGDEYITLSFHHDYEQICRTIQHHYYGK